jgi:nitrite reductase (NADH) small subunit
VRTLALTDLNVAVFCLADGRLFGIEDRCPHRGARLSAGLIYDEDKVACADHGWGIRLRDGRVESPGQGCARVFPVKVEDGLVLVLV